MTNTLSAFDQDSKPICHGSPRPLLELALIKTALNIWLQKFNEFYHQAEENKYIRITKLSFNFEGSSEIPMEIKKMINAWMFPIAIELNKWVKYIYYGLNIFNPLHDRIYTRFNLVVFGGNGTVHFKDTVANFLEDDSLNNITRFEIACLNCVEEKIDFLWPLVSNKLNVDDLRFDDDFLLYYWICRKKGELNRIPLKEFSCIEHLMFVICRQNLRECSRYSYYPAIEYFLISLNPDNRLAELKELFKLGRDGNFAIVFPSIDGPTQRQILDEHPARILFEFVTSFSPVEYSIQCFLYIRNSITAECFCFYVIERVMTFINETAFFSTCQFDAAPIKEIDYCYKQIDFALKQIWLITPPNLKKCALENLSTISDWYNVGRKLNFRPLDFGGDIKFLLAVLSDADVYSRNYFWIESWHLWVFCVPLSSFVNLMELCLMKPESIEEFKSTLPHNEIFQSRCSELFVTGCFTPFDEFFSGLYSDQNLILEIKKRILINEAGIFLKPGIFLEKYIKYIDNLFPSSEQAADFKEHIIRSKPVLDRVLPSGLALGNDLETVKRMVSSLVLPEKHAEIKNMFLEWFRNYITNGRLFSFNKFAWSQFLNWCTDGDEQLVDEFMQSLQIDVAFEAAFIESSMFTGYYESEEVCSSLYSFFVWYFKSEDQTRNYIREKADYYEKMDAGEIQQIIGENIHYVVDWMKSSLYDNEN